MRYFTVTIKMTAAVKHGSDEYDAMLEQLAAECTTYMDKRKGAFTGCVTGISGKECRIAFAGNGSDKELRREMRLFRKEIGVSGKLTDISEVCSYQLRHDIRRYDHMYNIDLMEAFDLDIIYRSDTDERLASSAADTDLLSYAQQRHFPELEAEAKRIGAAPAADGFYGHPVHYILEENNYKKAEETVDLLVQTLYQAGRVQSPRIIAADADAVKGMHSGKIAKMYKNLKGCTIMISLASEDNDGEFADASLDAIEHVCRCALQYRHDVLTVFHIPHNNAEARRAIAANLDNALTMITFSETAGDFEASKAYMEMLCAQKGVQDPAPFIAKMDPEQSVFYTEELDRIFHANYTDHLKNVYFPAYRECQNSAVKETKMEGTAADTLSEMIGLDRVKGVIESAVSYYRMQQIYRQNGIHLNSPARSMVFTGNPGTAKTTVARLTAKIFHQNGLLESGKIVEVGRGDLVGKFVGWTAPTVKAAFRRAKGSILFIDEAYALCDDREGMYGDEAINTIVQEMENHRDEVIVIFAGYPDKMEAFLKRNPGLRSRVAFHVDFPDYTPDDLLAILRLMAKNQSFTIDTAAEEKLLAIFRNAVRIEDFGNGRFVRNLLEQATMHIAQRLTNGNTSLLTREQLTTLIADDFVMPELCAAVPDKIAIGF